MKKYLLLICIVLVGFSYDVSAEHAQKCDTNLIIKLLTDLLKNSNLILPKTVDIQERIGTISAVCESGCNVTISQTDFVSGVYTISSPGVYCLTEDVTGQILIDADSVVLDLKQQTITNTSDNCVEVSGQSRVTIKNGSVIAVSNAGIAVLSGSAQVTIEDITSYGSAVGIDVASSDNVYVEGCDLLASNTGVIFDTVSRAEVNNTTVSDSVYIGFLLDASSRSLFTNCHALNTGQGLTNLTSDIYGFFSSDGSSNIFSECIAQNTLALTVTGEPNVAAGFAFSGTESKSKISKCTSNVIQTDPNGFAIPYGILLQYSFDSLTTVTGGNQGIENRVVAWSSDGAYLAVGGNTETPNEEIQMFSFNRETGALTLTDTQSQGDLCNAVAWFPDGTYLATTGNTESGDFLQIFSFDGGTGKLTKTDGAILAGNTTVSWSPDGAYLAAGGSVNNEIQIFPFDRASGTLGARTDGKNQGSKCFTVAWSPDGNYLATGGFPQSGDEIQMFSFNRAAGTLIKTDGKSQGTVVCNSVSWSPDGAYLATAGQAEPGPLGDEIQLFSFNPSTGTLTKVDGEISAVAVGNALAWSPDGAFLAAGLSSSSNDDITILSFDPSTELLTSFTRQNQNRQCLAVDWSPDGAYLATGGSPQNLSEFQVFKAFLFPSRNSITDNTVKSASRSSSIAAGVGISGSSIENLIIGNSSYNNGGFNYWFVTNVFDERFATIPTAVQNISIKLPPLFYSPSP